MSSKRGVRRRSCDGKIQYTDIEDAWKAARNGNRRDGSGAIIPYKCRFCGFYHVGHMPKKVRKIFQAKGLR